MKFLKTVGIILLILLLLFLALSFIMPKEYTVSKSRTIDAPRSLVFGKVNDLSQNAAWNYWAVMDTTMKVTVGKPSIGKGGNYSWTSEKMGSGTYTTTDLVHGDQIDLKMEFESFPPGTGTWTFEDADKGTEVNWSFNGSSKWPMNVFNFIGKSALGKSFKNGLEMLDKSCQSDMSKALKKYDIKSVEFPYTSFLAKKGKVEFAEIEKFYQNNLRSIYSELLDRRMDPVGQPCALFFTWDEAHTMTDMAAGIPIDQSIDVDGFDNINIENTEAFMIEYYGDPAMTIDAHMAMDYHLYKEGLDPSDLVVEEYVTDPTEFPGEPNKWLTKIYYQK